MIAALAPGPARTGEDAAFTPFDWALLTGLAVTWGSSFLFIAVGLEAFAPAAVTLLRIVFGAATLALVPRARAGVPRAAWPAIVALGVVWIAVPLLLFPLAQRTVSSSLAGMLNGSVPLFTAAVAAVLHRRLPAPAQRVGLATGFLGVVAISAPALRGATADVAGVLMLVAAVTCYGVALNVAAPLQRRYGALPVLLRAQLVAAALSAPLGLWGLRTSTLELGSLAAVAALGALGTGLAFAAMTTLVGRVGPTRGSVAIYCTPVVAIALGVLLRSEAVTPVQLVGTALVLLGAWLTSRAPSSRPVSVAAAR